MGSRERIVGGIALFCVFLIFLVTVAFQSPSNSASDFLFNFYARTFNDPSKPFETAIVARWYLAAIGLNAVSVGCAIALTFLKDGVKRFDLFMIILLTLITLTTFGSLIYAERSTIDFTAVTLGTVAVYVLSDLWGMNKAARIGSPEHVLYWLPFWCLDFPMLIVLAIFLVARYVFQTISLEFYEGVGIGAMSLGAICYIALMTSVVNASERKR